MPLAAFRLESLPVELIADILSELDLDALISIAYVSRRLRNIASDSALNPWRKPILCILSSDSAYHPALQNLSVRTIVPRHNWIEILSLARPAYLLYEATLPNLRAIDWEECFRRRFLPGWIKWKKDASWKEVFLKLLYRIAHRSQTSCTSDEAWTKYIVVNRNGSANQLEIASRTFNPLVIFNEMKLQSNLMHLETRVRLVVRLTDVRILAFGTLNRPRASRNINPNAHAFLHPPGIDNLRPANLGSVTSTRASPIVDDHGVYPMQGNPHLACASFDAPTTPYVRLTHPMPAPSHSRYPFATPGGGDKRWLGSEFEEEGLNWVGPLLIVAQVLGPHTHELSGDWPPLLDLDLVVGPGRSQYASFVWRDLWAIAPWMEDRITKRIDGPGLGL